MNEITTSALVPDGLISPKEARRLCGGLSASTMWREARRGHFPRPVQISAGRVAYVRAEILEWIASRPRAGAAIDERRRRRRPQTDRAVN